MSEERQNLLDIIKEKDAQHKAAIRWLFDAERFRLMYVSEEWRGDVGAQLHSISEKDFAEAQKLVISTRKALDKARQDLINFDKKGP